MNITEIKTDTCCICKKEKQVAVVVMDGKNVNLCQRHLWTIAEMKLKKD